MLVTLKGSEGKRGYHNSQLLHAIYYLYIITAEGDGKVRQQ